MSDFPATLDHFDPVDRKLIARNRLRTHSEDFPHEEIEIVGGLMGKDCAPPY
jgi:hypothetical protein